jgi:5-methylcytosine-specific restriction endonuclease McrA
MMPRRPPSLYDHHYRRVREFVLERDGHRCYKPGCTTRATTADHIVPVSEAPHLRLDPDNMRASCLEHNVGRVSGRMAAMARINRMTAPVREW